MQCIETTKAGNPCSGTALRDSVYCWFHDPDKADERLTAQSKGGGGRSDDAKFDEFTAMVRYLAGKGYRERIIDIMQIIVDDHERLVANTLSAARYDTQRAEVQPVPPEPKDPDRPWWDD